MRPAALSTAASRACERARSKTCRSASKASIARSASGSRSSSRPAASSPTSQRNRACSALHPGQPGPALRALAAVGLEAHGARRGRRPRPASAAARQQVVAVVARRRRAPRSPAGPSISPDSRIRAWKSLFAHIPPSSATVSSCASSRGRQVAAVAVQVDRGEAGEQRRPCPRAGRAARARAAARAPRASPRPARTSRPLATSIASARSGGDSCAHVGERQGAVPVAERRTPPGCRAPGTPARTATRAVRSSSARARAPVVDLARASPIRPASYSRVPRLNVLRSSPARSPAAFGPAPRSPRACLRRGRLAGPLAQPGQGGPGVGGDHRRGRAGRPARAPAVGERRSASSLRRCSVWARACSASIWARIRSSGCLSSSAIASVVT